MFNSEGCRQRKRRERDSQEVRRDETDCGRRTETSLNSGTGSEGVR